MGNIRRLFIGKFRQMIGIVRIHTHKIPLPGINVRPGPKTNTFFYHYYEIAVFFLTVFHNSVITSRFRNIYHAS